MTSVLVAAALVALGLAPLQRAGEVREALGVNAHIEYTDGEYRDLGHVLAELQYLGTRNVRDAAPNPANQGQAGYAALAKAGVKFDLFVNGEPIPPAVKRLRDLEREAPGTIVSIEGPNEVNNLAGFNFQGERNPHKAATIYQAALYAQVKATPGLAGIPVLAFTDYPYTFGRADVQNEHPYQPGDRAPGWGLKAVVQAVSERAPGAPLVFTETGYSTSHAPADVSELAQARLTLTSLLDAATLGVKRTYLYELLDAYPDPSGVDHEKHFGLFNRDHSPKLAARTLRHVTALLEDGAPNSLTFPVRKTAITLSGGGADLRSLVLEKAGGEEIVALWRESPVYVPASRSDVELAPVAVDLRLPGSHGVVTILDPVAEKQGRLHAGANLVRVPLASNPVFVQVGVASAPA